MVVVLVVVERELVVEEPGCWAPVPTHNLLGLDLQVHLGLHKWTGLGLAVVCNLVVVENRSMLARLLELVGLHSLAEVGKDLLGLLVLEVVVAGMKVDQLLLMRVEADNWVEEVLEVDLDANLARPRLGEELRSFHLQREKLCIRRC